MTISYNRQGVHVRGDSDREAAVALRDWLIQHLDHEDEEDA